MWTQSTETLRLCTHKISRSNMMTSSYIFINFQFTTATLNGKKFESLAVESIDICFLSLSGNLSLHVPCIIITGDVNC